MRFRKSVKVCKGVKLNVSKSGASLTVAPMKGVSFNLGGKGAFLNWSIPGTGVYDRVRLDTLLKDKLGGLGGLGGLFGGGKQEEQLQQMEPVQAHSPLTLVTPSQLQLATQKKNSLRPLMLVRPPLDTGATRKAMELSFGCSIW